MRRKKYQTSFETVAKEYDKKMGGKGDYTHQNTIDPALFRAIGDFKGKAIYDVACGNGYIARRLARESAKEVWASDVSSSLISIAKTKYENPDNKIKYFVLDASNFSKLPKNYFDLVVMNMAIHYVKDVNKFAKGLSVILKRGGRFVFTTAHPLRKVSVFKMKEKDASEFGGVVSNAKKYIKPRSELVYNHWSKKKDLLIYKAPISYYINALSQSGILTDILIEPPTKTTKGAYLDSTPTETTIPTIYALGATKKTH